MFSKYVKFLLFSLCFPLAGSCSLALGPETGSDNGSVFDYFWDTFDKQYSLFEQKGIDWDALRETYRDQAVSALTEDALFDVLSEMIEPMDDAHVWLSGTGGYPYCDTWEEPGIPSPWYSFSLYGVRQYTGPLDQTAEDLVSYGMLTGRNIAYIHISSMADDLGGLTTLEPWVDDVDRIIDQYMDTDALIIDIRNNNGGYSANARHIASRFVSQKSLYLKTRTRVGPAHNDFGSVTDHYIEPRGKVYTKPVYLVTDPWTISAAEWFTLMMRKSANVTHIGWRTTGATGMVSFHELSNGWEFSTTIGYTTDEEGRCYEGTGIQPEIVIPYDPAEADSVMAWILSQ